MAFIWGDNGAQLSPEQIAARRKAADALMLAGSDASPIRSWTQGAARVAQGVMGGLDYREADNAEKANSEENKKLIASLLGGGTATAPDASISTSPAVASAAPSAAPSDGKMKIYSNDEPNPMDIPVGEDRRKMIATIVGEAGNESQLGKNAVASVIRTRAVDGGYGGDTPSAVVTAPNQFEPWNTPQGRARMTAAAADPKQAAAADAAIASAYGEGGRAPEDPTEGMTHFYSPKGQAALGRAAPAWAGGESVTIGGHVFNSPDDAKVAAADPAAIPANATPTQGALPTAPVAKVAGALNGVNPGVLAALTSPYASDSTKKIASALLTAQLSQEGKAPISVAKGSSIVDPRTGRVVYKAPDEEDKKPSSVLEYEYYKKNFQPTAQSTAPMGYDAWATAKARAAATNVNTNVDTRAETELSKTVGKAQGEVIGEDIKAGSHASSKLRQLATLDEANKSGGDDVSSGPFGKAILSGKQGLSEITGIDLKGVPESEVIQKVGFGLATNMVKAITARPSQMEFGKALENVPGLYMSKMGRVAMTSILAQDARAEQEIGRRANKTENHKNWQEVKDQYYADHPLMSPFTGKPFGEADIQMLTTAGKGYPATPTGAPKVVNGYTIKELP